MEVYLLLTERGSVPCPRRLRRTVYETAFAGGFRSAFDGHASGPNVSWDNPRHRDRSLRSSRGGSNRPKGQPSNPPGTHDRDERGPELCRLRTAPRHKL